MSISSTFFTDFFEEFLSVSAGKISGCISQAELLCGIDTPDPEELDTFDLYNSALLYLTAHFLAELTGLGTDAGPVISKTDGSITVSYADRGSGYTATGDYASTSYGRHYQALCDQNGSCLVVC